MSHYHQKLIPQPQERFLPIYNNNDLIPPNRSPSLSSLYSPDPEARHDRAQQQGEDASTPPPLPKQPTPAAQLLLTSPCH